MGVIQVTKGPQPIFLAARCVPAFNFNSISVSQLVRGKNILVTRNEVSLSPVSHPPSKATLKGRRNAQNVYDLINVKVCFVPPVVQRKTKETEIDHTRSVSTILPTCKTLTLHTVFNHTDVQRRRHLPSNYSKVSCTLSDITETQCTSCIIGTAFRSPFRKSRNITGRSRPQPPLDTSYAGTRGPVSPPDPRGNRYLRLMVDAASGLKTGQPLRTKVSHRSISLPRGLNCKSPSVSQPKDTAQTGGGC